MRENIGLYRGQRADNGEWIEGWLVIKNDPVLEITYCYILAQGKGESFVTWYSVDPETVGECVGKRDKNGKKIFEGDIVRLHGEDLPGWYRKKPLAVVKYNDDCGFEPLCEYDGYCEGFVRPTDCEIIGNIHDLKGDEHDGDYS